MRILGKRGGIEAGMIAERGRNREYQSGAAFRAQLVLYNGVSPLASGRARRLVARQAALAPNFLGETTMRLATTSVLLLLSLAIVGTAQAAENPTGKWTWEQMRGDQKREVTLNLKLDGDKLTGSMPGRNNTETPIADAKYKDGEISFTVTREFNNMKITTKYNGKISGDTIKGKMESER